MGVFDDLGTVGDALKVVEGQPLTEIAQEVMSGVADMQLGFAHFEKALALAKPMLAKLEAIKAAAAKG